jgi:hypothetical protein
MHSLTFSLISRLLDRSRLVMLTRPCTRVANVDLMSTSSLSTGYNLFLRTSFLPKPVETYRPKLSIHLFPTWTREDFQAGGGQHRKFSPGNESEVAEDTTSSQLTSSSDVIAWTTGTPAGKRRAGYARRRDVITTGAGGAGSAGLDPVIAYHFWPCSPSSVRRR